MVLDLRLSKDWDVEMTSFLFLPSSPLSLGPPAGIWTALRPLELFGTALGLWNAPPASGTEPWLYLDRPQGYLAVLVLFVGRR